MVVQLCWWCPQCHKERSSQQTSKTWQFHRSTHQIYHRTPSHRWTPFLDTLTRPTPNSTESTVYRKPIYTDRSLDYNSNCTISAKLSVFHTLMHRAKQVCPTHLNPLQKKWITFTRSYKTTTTQHSSFNKANPKWKPTKSQTHQQEKGARVVIPYIKGLSEQYRHTLAKYKVRGFFKGMSTIKSLLIHPKDPIPDAQKTDIIYHWKCPANNCTAEYIGETNRALKERVSDHRNQTTSAIKNHHDSTKHPKAELKRFHNNRQRQQQPTPSIKRTTSHLYQRSITQQKHWQSQNPFSIQQTSQTFQTTRAST